ncbi:DMT family transporter [Solicola sp. PLA-1-18]|uniref:DMT family transporter n=1 Tax=Solicola sp. PLA-1-18 TaxID=3380532 RepID=UPI003B799D0C
MASERSYALAALGGASFIAFSGPLVRLAEATPTASALMRVGLALPVLWLMVRLEERRPRSLPGTRQRWLMRLGGAFLAVDLVLWVHAIEAVGAGLATVLANLQVLFVGVLGWWLLAEKPARTLVLALPVMLGGVVLVSGVVGDGAYGSDPVAGVVFGLATSLMYAGYILLMRLATRTAVPTGAARAALVRPLYEATLGATAAALVMAVALPGFDVNGAQGFGWTLVIALSSQVVGWMLISMGMPHLPAAVTSALLLVQPVLSVVIARLLFDETPSPSQLLGVLLVLAGVMLTTLGTRTRRAAAADPVPAPA